ncbi:MAG TPA: thioredoxin reductase [Lachnospiraceae bacterium]|nr:thioredoxin reductase [Lachnospiraceae bacterium]
MVYDAAVIGTGPAGFSAALNLKIHGKNFIWIGSKNLSEKAGKAERIDNYPGLSHITGKELNEMFGAQAEAMGLTITEQMVNSIAPMGANYALMAGSEFYETRAVILATGTARTAVLPGESALVGKGVSYCATCDGGLYRGRTIAVVCNAARFEHEAEFLAGLAAGVYYFPLYKDPALSGENVELMEERAVEILGEERVSGVKLKSGREIAVDGVFCLRDSVALASLLPSLETEEGHIAVDREMATNLPGVYAAGDCTGRPYQYAKAVGEGNVAAHSVIAYLAGKE